MTCLKSLYLTFLLIPILAMPAFAERDFSIDQVYNRAVPDFLYTITETVEGILNSDQLQDVADWNNANMERLGEFLDDFTVAAQGLEENFNEEYVFGVYEGLVNKWDDVAASFPHYEEIAPAIEGHLQELFAGFPAYQPRPKPPYEASPMAGLSEYYNEAEQVNPWGMGSIWNDDLLIEETKRFRTAELTHETKKHGTKQVHFLQKDLTAETNGEIIFSKTIENDETVDKFVQYRPPTLFHEILEGAIADNLGQDWIDGLQGVVDVIDEGLFGANQEEVLDDCSYAFIQRGAGMELEEICTDNTGEIQNFDDMLDSDPFDGVNREFIGYEP